MSGIRFPPRTPPAAPKRSADSDGGNALWRIPQWFPDLNSRTLEMLRIYHTELLKFNSRVNLISRSSEREADENHFADCLLAVQVMERAGLTPEVFDIGSGNGLPGLIFAVLDPSREFVLVDSDSRKAEFLKHVAHTLSLKNVEVRNIRLESLQGTSIQTGVSRGFASISKTCLMCNRIFPVGGRFFHLKGAGWPSEIAEIPTQLIVVWKPELVGDYSLPVSQARRAIVCTTKLQ